MNHHLMRGLSNLEHIYPLIWYWSEYTYRIVYITSAYSLIHKYKWNIPMYGFSEASSCSSYSGSFSHHRALLSKLLTSWNTFAYICTLYANFLLNKHYFFPFWLISLNAAFCEKLYFVHSHCSILLHCVTIPQFI